MEEIIIETINPYDTNIKPKEEPIKIKGKIYRMYYIDNITSKEVNIFLGMTKSPRYLSKVKTELLFHFNNARHDNNINKIKKKELKYLYGKLLNVIDTNKIYIELVKYIDLTNKDEANLEYNNLWREYII